MDRYKSLLFVPAKGKMLSKIDAVDADAFIIDLEDSIEEDYKEEAISNVIAYLEKSTVSKDIFVRINKDKALSECIRLQNTEIKGFILPKFETPKEYLLLGEKILENYQIIALIETPKGVVNLPEISSCPWVNALAFGAEDYTAATNMKNTKANLLYVKSKLLTYAKAENKPVFDTPSMQLSEENLLEEEIQDSFDMGFDGKMAINPSHIRKINDIFRGHDPEYIKSIIEEYEKAGKAVVVIEGRIYEKMHINHLRRILKERAFAVDSSL